MPGRQPPRFVPTLTEVVQGPAAAAPAPPGPTFDAISQEHLVHRVMQRIDLTLDQRLREAIASTVIEQTRNLAPLLREEIEAAVRQSVSQALADELSASEGRLPK